MAAPTEKLLEKLKKIAERNTSFLKESDEITRLYFALALAVAECETKYPRSQKIFHLDANVYMGVDDILKYKCEILKYLIEKGVNLNTKNEIGENILHKYPRLTSMHNFMKILIDGGFDFLQTDDDNENMFDVLIDNQYILPNSRNSLRVLIPMVVEKLTKENKELRQKLQNRI